MASDLQRMPGESEQHYIHRVCDHKEEIGGWNDVADFLNAELGYDYSESKYRKAYQYYMTMHNDCDFVAEEAEKLNDIREELKKERIKLQETKREVDRAIRHEARMELLYDNIKDSIEHLPHECKCELGKIAETSNSEYLLAISDVHYGAKFDAINNSYSRKICRERFDLLLAKASAYCEARNIKRINIVSLGDSLQGILRLKDLSINEINVVDAVIEYANILSTFLNALSATVAINYYHVPAANHTQTRPLNSSASEFSGEDLEKIILAYVKESLRNNSDVVIYGDPKIDNVVMNIAGFSVCGIHGHQIKNIENSVKDLSQLYGENYDYVIMGHYHSGRTVTVGEGLNYEYKVFVAPSIVGSDPYSDKLMKGAKSAACIYEFDRMHGHVGTKTLYLN